MSKIYNHNTLNFKYFLLSNSILIMHSSLPPPFIKKELKKSNNKIDLPHILIPVITLIFPPTFLNLFVVNQNLFLSYLFPCKINDSYVLTFAFSISLNQLKINIGTYYLQTLGRKRPNFRIRMKS